MPELSPEAKAEIAEAVKILKSDGIHVHKTYPAFLKAQKEAEEEAHRMVEVYRQVDAGKRSLADRIAVRAADRAPGSGIMLHLHDGMEFTVTLKDDMHAEIHPGGAPPNMKPIPVEKVR